MPRAPVDNVGFRHRVPLDRLRGRDRLRRLDARRRRGVHKARLHGVHRPCQIASGLGDRRGIDRARCRGGFASRGTGDRSGDPEIGIGLGLGHRPADKGTADRVSPSLRGVGTRADSVGRRLGLRCGRRAPRRPDDRRPRQPRAGDLAGALHTIEWLALVPAPAKKTSSRSCADLPSEKPQESGVILKFRVITLKLLPNSIAKSLNGVLNLLVFEIEAEVASVHFVYLYLPGLLL